jgi:hypothetical protein
LQRSFHANDKNFVVLELSTGREVKLKEGLISELIPGLTESTYRNTISIEQLKAATDAELAAQVRNYITNLSIAKSKEVNVAKAVSLLTDQRKQLEASQNAVLLKDLQAAIDEGLEREEKMDQLTIKLRTLLAEEQSLLRQKELEKDNIGNETIELAKQLPAILEKYRYYQELIRQQNSLEQQLDELNSKVADRKNKQQTVLTLKEDMIQLQKLQGRLNELDKTDLERNKEKERLSKGARLNVAVSILPATIIVFLAWAVTGFKPKGLLIFSAIILAGALGLFILFLLQSRKQKAFNDKENDDGQEKALVQRQLKDILEKYGATKAEELLSQQEESIRNSYALEQAEKQQEELNKQQARLEERRDMVYEEIMRYLQHFIREDELTEEVIDKLKEVIADKCQVASEKAAQINRQQENNRLNIEKLRWEISCLEGNEEELLKNQEKYEEIDRKQKEAAVELEAVKLALSVINGLSTEIHDSFGLELNTAVTKVISKITGQKYNDLKVDEKLDVKVGLNDGYVLLERLSAGTIDQIYFALRTAVADLLLGKNEVPLLLDDSLALYDEMRVKACLKELSQKKQVILFTCHKREQQLLKELGIDYHLVEL